MSVVIEFTGNQNLFFRPLSRTLRGRLDFKAMEEDGAVKLARLYGAIPGQRMSLDDKGNAILEEPLHEQENEQLAAKLKARGNSLPPAREEFQKVDVPSWAYWLRRAIESGHAVILEGELPEAEGVVRKDYFHAPVQDARDELAKKQLAAQLAVMTPAQRKDYEKILSELS